MRFIKESIIRNSFQERVIAAQDLRDEAKQYGHRLHINSDGSITLYHGTSKENASKIHSTGILLDGTYFASTKADAKYYAQEKNKDGVVLALNLDARYIELAAAGAEFYSPYKLKRVNDIYTK